MNHLSEEQMTELLMGEAPDAAAAAHLEICAQCRGQANLFADAVGDFSTASLRWAESRPSVSLRARAASRQRMDWLAPVGWAVVAAALVVGVPVWQHGHPAAAPVVTASAGMNDSAAQIAADNKMLAQVDVALGAEDESPLSEYGLRNGAPENAMHHGEAKVQ